MLYREIIAVCSQIHTKHINTLVKRKNSRVSHFVKLDVRDFDHRWSSILISLFRPFIWMSPHGWRVDCCHSHSIVQATPTSVIKARSFSEWGRKLAYFGVSLCFSHSKCYPLSNVFTFYQHLTSPLFICYFRVFFHILLPPFHKSLQQNIHFTLQIDFDVRDSNVHDGLVAPLLTTVIENFLY
jgi:hypothetical protein